MLFDVPDGLHEHGRRSQHRRLQLVRRRLLPDGRDDRHRVHGLDLQWLHLVCRDSRRLLRNLIVLRALRRGLHECGDHGHCRRMQPVRRGLLQVDQQWSERLQRVCNGLLQVGYGLGSVLALPDGHDNRVCRLNVRYVVLRRLQVRRRRELCAQGPKPSLRCFCRFCQPHSLRRNAARLNERARLL
jgi:hypothetical protein